VALVNVTQKVQVQISGSSRRYTYGWVFNPLEGGRPLREGDKVEIPPNMVQADGGSATVVALNSTYDGPLKSIVRVIDGPKAQAPEDDLWGGWGTGEYA
jgi:hypothetical protein